MLFDMDINFRGMRPGQKSAHTIARMCICMCTQTCMCVHLCSQICMCACLFSHLLCVLVCAPKLVHQKIKINNSVKYSFDGFIVVHKSDLGVTVLPLCFTPNTSFCLCSPGLA